jgi:hypothetical protein
VRVTDPPVPAEPGLIVLGEVRTGLLSNRGALTREQAERLLKQLRPGEPVLTRERPIAHTRSAPVVTGLDSHLAVSADGRRRARAVGTVASHASLTGGTILQCSTVASVRPATAGRREQWSHYTARPGSLETLAVQEPERVREGFLSEGAQRTGLADFGAVCDRLARRVQNSAMLQGTAPLLFQWTRLRWAAWVPDERPAEAATPKGTLQLTDDLSRALRVNAFDSSAEEISEFCGDLALHDWILTTVIRRMERISGLDAEEDVREISPVISRLLHLWMPAARVNAELAEVWEGFEQRPGFSRQWNSLVARMRDQLSLHTALQRGVLINHDS